VALQVVTDGCVPPVVHGRHLECQIDVKSAHVLSPDQIVRDPSADQDNCISVLPENLHYFDKYRFRGCYMSRIVG
jgi:hypothetical protein